MNKQCIIGIITSNIQTLCTNNNNNNINCRSSMGRLCTPALGILTFFLNSPVWTLDSTWLRASQQNFQQKAVVWCTGSLARAEAPDWTCCCGSPTAGLLALAQSDKMMTASVGTKAGVNRRSCSDCWRRLRWKAGYLGPGWGCHYCCCCWTDSRVLVVNECWSTVVHSAHQHRTRCCCPLVPFQMS